MKTHFTEKRKLPTAAWGVPTEQTAGGGGAPLRLHQGRGPLLCIPVRAGDPSSAPPLGQGTLLCIPTRAGDPSSAPPLGQGALLCIPTGAGAPPLCPGGAGAATSLCMAEGLHGGPETTCCHGIPPMQLHLLSLSQGLRKASVPPRGPGAPPHSPGPRGVTEGLARQGPRPSAAPQLVA